MDLGIKIEDHNDQKGDPPLPPKHGADTSAAEAALNAKLSRKRTKTGCLTCRKRRIKCGEERPTCRNCHKSKRHCEGYSQRVVFKHPTFDYRPLPNGAHITFQAGTGPGPMMPFADLSGQPAGFDAAMMAGQLRPRPLEQFPTIFDPRSQNFVAVQPPPPFGGTALPVSPTSPLEQIQAHFLASAPLQPQGIGATAVPFSPMGPPQMQQTMPGDFQGIAMPTQSPSQPQMPFNIPHSAPNLAGFVPMPIHSPSHTPFPATTTAGYFTPGHQHTLSTSSAAGDQKSNFPPMTPSGMTQTWTDTISTNSTSLGQTSPSSATFSGQTVSYTSSPVSAQPQWQAPVFVPRPELSNPIDFQPTVMPSAPMSTQDMQAMASQMAQATPFPFLESGFPLMMAADSGHMLEAAAVETFDDDYYDVGSDDEDAENHGILQVNGHLALGRILGTHDLITHDGQMRRYDTFIYPGFLDHYRVEEVANPLKNDATKRVFAHFISATGPSLSIFERHVRNSSVLFATGNVPLSQRGLWTYTLPMAALRNQGLLQAMLALASLHIARLQGGSTTPSMQHYAWALKNIHASVGRARTKRLHTTTIAATLLLGFYEVMTADHMKWNMHLAGSKQLFVETDFVGMTQELRRMRREVATQMDAVGPWGSPPDQAAALLNKDVDERVVSVMVGREVRYDDHGKVEPEVKAESPKPSLDVAKFEVLQDLYWWYCKQDVYQSIVSGNPLLMDFSRWANCPPRAPLGRPDAVHGSFDHLTLLLGRIADFASRDRARKLKQVEANGGQWRPPPGMQMPRPPPGAGPPPPAAAPPGMTNGNTGPGGVPAQMFFGMAPPPRANVQMPSSYHPNGGHRATHSTSSAGSDQSSYDLHAATLAAKEEFGRIRAALLRFREAISGPGFQPLAREECMPPAETPERAIYLSAFGPAAVYRSTDIGCLWAIYHMAEIIALRSHPDMPPAAHMAAGVAAEQTHYHAQEIGRIAAGVYLSTVVASRTGVSGSGGENPAFDLNATTEDGRPAPLNPTLGAACCESCMPSFFAAIQYRDAAQRAETVTRIAAISRRTGWGSGELIANGIETAWVKAAEAGRGPPYTRVLRADGSVAPVSDDPRLNGSWEKLDPNGRPDGSDEGDRRLIKSQSKARLFWGLGVIGREDDL